MSTYRYIVSDNKLLTPTLRSIVLELEEGRQPLLFEPGQYAAISLYDRARPSAYRCFSIVSSPTDRQHLEFAARVGGVYTKALERLNPGDAVRVRGPFGNFIFNNHAQQSVVLFAGGIGVTPFMSMIRYASELRLPNAVHLVSSCRNQTDIPFFEELIGLTRLNPRFKLTFVIGEGDTDRLGGARVIVGRVDTKSLPLIGIDPEKDVCMICGPSGYITAMQHLLHVYGLPHRHILSESFAQGSRHESSTLVRWPANTYALSGVALLLAGLAVASTDLASTLPRLKAEYEPATQVEQATLEGVAANDYENIQAVPPQVDTDYSTDSVIEQVIVEDVVVPVMTKSVVTPTPVVAPTPVPEPVVVEPTPTPTPTVKPTTKPKTRVS